MWAVRTEAKYWLSLESYHGSPILAWGGKQERILFSNRETAVKALRASPWSSKKVLVKVSG